MIEALPLSDVPVGGSIIVFLVLGMLRYIDDIVEVLVSLDGSAPPDVPDQPDST